MRKEWKCARAGCEKKKTLLGGTFTARTKFQFYGVKQLATRTVFGFAVSMPRNERLSSADVVSAVHAEFVQLLGGHEVFGT